MYKVPNDIILYEIYKPLPEKNIYALICINKHINSILIDEYVKLKATIKIQRFYKNNLPRFESDTDWSIDNISNNLKHNIIRYYIAKYPMEYLIRYPEFYVLKYLKNDFNIVNWIKKNLPPVKNRTRRHIREFFYLDTITAKGICYCGW